MPGQPFSAWGVLSQPRTECRHRPGHGPWTPELGDKSYEAGSGSSVRSHLRHGPEVNLKLDSSPPVTGRYGSQLKIGLGPCGGGQQTFTSNPLQSDSDCNEW